MTSPASALLFVSRCPRWLALSLWLLTVVGCGRDPNDSAAISESVAISDPTEPSLVQPAIGSDSAVKRSTERPAVETPEESIADAKTLLVQAGEALQAGNIRVAGQTIRQAVLMEPNDPQIVFTMAMVLGQEHRFPEAVLMLDKLSRDVPETRLPALGQTAEWLVIQGDWKEAESRFREVLEEVPDAAMAHRQLALLLLRQGRQHQASSHLQALCRLGNIEEIELRCLLNHDGPFAADFGRDSLEPIGSLGQARWAISNEDWDQAASVLMAVDSRTPSEWALLGRVHAMRGDMPSLEAWASDSGNDELPISDAWFARGVLEEHRSNHDTATHYFCNAILLCPTDHEAYQRMSASLAAAGALAEAEQALQRGSWLVKTQEIGNAMAKSDRRDENQIAELVRLLDQLRRPLESLSWRAVGVAYGSSWLSPDQQRSLLLDINRERLRWMKEPQLPPSEAFICCGLSARTSTPTAQLKRDSIKENRNQPKAKASQAIIDMPSVEN